MRVKKIGIVSLSSGIMGENFVKHELDIGLERLTLIKKIKENYA